MPSQFLPTGSLRITLADDGIPFDGNSLRQGALGGAESCVVWLAEALAALGHRVSVLTRTARPGTIAGVDWLPLEAGRDTVSAQTCDLFIANRGRAALALAPRRVPTVLWVHNPAAYLTKLKALWRVWDRQPTLVFLSRFHARTYPLWAPGRRVVIPHAVAPEFTGRQGPARTSPPPPRVVYLSNPRRHLDTLLDLWEQTILPQVPAAELHLYTGREIMGPAEAARDDTQAVLHRAAATPGVILQAPLRRDALAARLGEMRVFCYPTQVEESFCLAAAEAQAAGLPAVVSAVGALPERVIDGQTGFVVPDRQAAGQALVRLLTDDGLWLRMHQTALTQPTRTWADVARDFVGLHQG